MSKTKCGLCGALKVSAEMLPSATSSILTNNNDDTADTLQQQHRNIISKYWNSRRYWRSNKRHLNSLSGDRCKCGGECELRFQALI